MATNDFLPFGGGASSNVLTQAAYAALAARTAGFSSGVAKSAELNKVWRQSSLIAAAVAQVVADITGLDAVDDGTTTTLVANLKAAMRAQSIGVVGSSRNAKMLITAASATATFTADEIVVESSLGGLSYRVFSFNKTINLGTTGAGGMDVGTAPVSGFVGIYAIYNPTTGASALLATNATSAAAPEVYGGANMPSGYTASALVSVWQTNASGQLAIGYQVDRKIWNVNKNLISTSSLVTTPTSLSAASSIPLNAKTAYIGCSMQNINAGVANQLNIQPSSANPVMIVGVSANVSAGIILNSGSPAEMPILTPQTIYYYVVNTNPATYSVGTLGYTF